MVYERRSEQDDVDFCEECQAVVRDGGQHDKVKHLALPKGTVAYDQIIFESDSN
jgi:hypothetical protein